MSTEKHPPPTPLQKAIDLAHDWAFDQSELNLRDRIASAIYATRAWQAGVAFGVPPSGREEQVYALADAALSAINPSMTEEPSEVNTTQAVPDLRTQVKQALNSIMFYCDTSAVMAAIGSVLDAETDLRKRIEIKFLYEHQNAEFLWGQLVTAREHGTAAEQTLSEVKAERDKWYERERELQARIDAALAECHRPLTSQETLTSMSLRIEAVRVALTAPEAPGRTD